MQCPNLWYLRLRLSGPDFGLLSGQTKWQINEGAEGLGSTK